MASAAKVLERLGVLPSEVRSGVEFIIGRGEKPLSGEIVLTPRAKMVIELSVEEARRLSHSYIGTEHLLLGLIREGEGIAFGVLKSLGISLNPVRTEIARMLTEGTPPRTPSEPAFPELSRSSLRVAPNILAREHALRMLSQAQTALDTVDDSDLANDLLRDFVRAEVLSLIDLLNLIAERVQELNDAVNRARQCVSQLMTAETALKPHQPVLAEAINLAYVAVHRALATGSPPGFRRLST
jgi:ATP-dependent Clp protease ATP-binding subunit ClpA